MFVRFFRKDFLDASSLVDRSVLLVVPETPAGQIHQVGNLFGKGWVYHRSVFFSFLVCFDLLVFLRISIF